MSENSISPETLAALLDGTLPPDERERVLARIAKSPADYEAFADAAAVAREVGVVPLRRRWPWKVIVPALAAAVLAVVLLPRVGARAGSETWRVLRALDVGSARGAGSLAAALGGSWSDAGWSAVRGSGDAASGRARAVRIGVRLADVEAALVAGDTLALAPVQAELRSLVEGLDDGAPVAARLDRWRVGGLPDESSRRAVVADLQALLGDEPWFGLGCWLEAARLSAAASQAGFFGSDSRAALDQLRIGLRATPRGELRNSVMEGADSVAATLRKGPRTGDLAALAALLRTIIATAAE